jgi:hypothetical protein
MRIHLALLAIVVSSNVAAQTCETVIALSKTTSLVVQDRDSLEKHAAAFCSEYSRTRGSSSSSSFGASYKFLSASFGSGDASVDAVASRYCSAADMSVSRSDSYRQYVESIAPNAYSAYEQCLRSKDLRFNLDLGTVLPTEFSLAVAFIAPSRDVKTAEVTYSASSDVMCAWGNAAPATTNVLQSGSSDFLKCTRPDPSRRSYVRISNVATGSDNVLTIPWQAYSRDGVPVDSLKAMESAIERLTARISTLEARRIPVSAKPSLGNCKSWKDTNSSNPRMCGDGYVMTGLGQDNDVVCCSQELVLP